MGIKRLCIYTQHNMQSDQCRKFSTVEQTSLEEEWPLLFGIAVLKQNRGMIMEKYCHVLCFHRSKKNCSFPSERFQQDRIFFFFLCTPDNWISFFICQKNVRALILLRTLGVVAWNYLWFMTTVIKDLKPGIQRIDMTNMLDAALDFFAEDMCFIYPKCKKGTKSHRMTDFEGAFRMRNCTTFCRRPGWPVCGASSSSSSLQDFKSPRRPRGIFGCICKSVSERSGRGGETDGVVQPQGLRMV